MSLADTDGNGLKESEVDGVAVVDTETADVSEMVVEIVSDALAEGTFEFDMHALLDVEVLIESVGEFE